MEWIDADLGKVSLLSLHSHGLVREKREGNSGEKGVCRELRE